MSFRYNLDPSGLKTDNELWEALDVAQLKEVVSNIDAGLGNLFDYFQGFTTTLIDSIQLKPNHITTPHYSGHRIHIFLKSRCLRILVKQLLQGSLNTMSAKFGDIIRYGVIPTTVYQ